MATHYHTPAGRGFEQSLIYFHHCNSYWTSTVSSKTDPKCSAGELYGHLNWGAVLAIEPRLPAVLMCTAPQ